MAANSAAVSAADASAFVAPFPLPRTGMPPLRSFRGVPHPVKKKTSKKKEKELRASNFPDTMAGVQRF
jgi:hypothetical protein